MTWVMFSVLAVTIITAFRRGSDLLSPSRIYICVYSLLLGFYSLHLSRLQTPWSLTSTLLFWGASGAFLIAGLWIWILGKVKNPGWRLDFRAIREGLKRDAATLDWPWFRRVFFTCVAVFLISFIICTIIIGGVPAFMKHPDEVRIKFCTATLLTSYTLFFGPISLMLGMVLLWFSDPSTRERRRILASLGLVLVLYLTMITRYEIFRYLIFSVILYHYGRGRLRMRHVLMGVGLAAAVFLAGFLIRVKADSIAAFNEMVKVKMPKHLAWASNIYAYLANDFWNFDYAIRKYEDGDHAYPRQWGEGLFRALLWNLRLEWELIEAYHFDTLYNESATKVKGLNTVIYVWHFYKDFGIIGTLLMPLSAGLFVWKYYLNTLLKPTVLRIGVWGIIAAGIALSYHTPLWELWFVYLNLIVFVIAHRKAKVPKVS